MHSECPCLVYDNDGSSCSVVRQIQIRLMVTVPGVTGQPYCMTLTICAIAKNLCQNMRFSCSNGSAQLFIILHLNFRIIKHDYLQTGCKLFIWFISPVSCPYYNIAMKKPTYQSSINYGGVPSRAVDGNRDPKWSQQSCAHSGKENDPFWIVDLGRVFRISYVTITNRAECTYMSIGNNVHILYQMWTCNDV